MIRSRVLRLNVNTERAKSAIIGHPYLVLLNKFVRLDQVRANFLRRLNLWAQWVDDPNESNLLYSLGITPNGLTDLLVDGRFVLFGGKLDEEVAGVHGEKRWEKGIVWNLARVHAVAVAAGTCMDTDILAFISGKAVQDPVSVG